MVTLSNVCLQGVSVSEVLAASSTTEVPQRSEWPCQWSVDDVARHIIEIDPQLAVYLDLFRRHVILNNVLTPQPGLFKLFVSIAGNRRQSIYVAHQRYDDEVYGPQAWTGIETLQH